PVGAGDLRRRRQLRPARSAARVRAEHPGRSGPARPRRRGADPLDTGRGHIGDDERAGDAGVNARPRVVVIDDSTVIRGGFATVHPEVDVVGTYPTVEEFEADPVACDVVVLDLLLRGPQGGPPAVKQGRAAIRALRERGLPVCLYTDERRAVVLALCLRAGAHGVVHKSDPPAVMQSAVAQVREGRV